MSLEGRNVPDVNLLGIAYRKVREGERVALCIIVSKEGSGPRDVGAKLLVAEDGTIYGTLGGGFFERHVVSQALKAIQEGKSRMIKYSFVSDKEVREAVKTGLICGGVLTVYIDVIKPAPRAVVFGVGRVGKPLADLLNFVGFRVVVADLEEELIEKSRFPYAEVRLHGDLDEVTKKLKEVVRSDDYLLITHGEVEVDYRVLKEFITSDIKFVGLLGSRRKVVEFLKRLIKDGIPKDLIKSKLVAPVGVDIEVETPEEIAVSIVAQLITHYRGRPTEGLSIVSKFVEGLSK